MSGKVHTNQEFSSLISVALSRASNNSQELVPVIRPTTTAPAEIVSK
jgi:hypothetical protein